MRDAVTSQCMRASARAWGSRMVNGSRKYAWLEREPASVSGVGRSFSGGIEEGSEAIDVKGQWRRHTTTR